MPGDNGKDKEAEKRKEIESRKLLIKQKRVEHEETQTKGGDDKKKSSGQ